jgi:hypothetical protein
MPVLKKAYCFATRLISAMYKGKAQSGHNDHNYELLETDRSISPKKTISEIEGIR